MTLDLPVDPHSADPRSQVMTAGAYVLLDGRLLFMIGPTPDGERLAVVRLGGHREAGESPWECAAREVYEESGLSIRPLAPPCTYWLQMRDKPDQPEAIVPGDWPSARSDPLVSASVLAPAPLLVVRGSGAETNVLSVMYVAEAEGTPVPRYEAAGLLLLTPAEVVGLVNRPVTLGQHLRAGGRVLLREPLDPHLPLEPFRQLRVLAVLLARHPGLFSPGQV